MFLSRVKALIGEGSWQLAYFFLMFEKVFLLGIVCG